MADVERLERIVYTPREVARLLGISRTTVYRLIQSGDIPTVRMGENGRVLIPKRPFLERFGAADEASA
jgi:excisionase family DNA binding protein